MRNAVEKQIAYCISYQHELPAAGTQTVYPNCRACCKCSWLLHSMYGYELTPNVLLKPVVHKCYGIGGAITRLSSKPDEYLPSGYTFEYALCCTCTVFYFHCPSCHSRLCHNSSLTTCTLLKVFTATCTLHACTVSPKVNGSGIDKLHCKIALADVAVVPHFSKHEMCIGRSAHLYVNTTSCKNL